MRDPTRTGPAGVVTPAELWRDYDAARVAVDNARSALVQRITRIAAHVTKGQGKLVVEVDPDGVVVTQYLGRGFKTLRLTPADIMRSPAPVIENHFKPRPLTITIHHGSK